MLFTSETFIGIDPTAGGKPFTYAAIDAELRLLALGEGGLDDVLAFAAGQRMASVAVCAPRQPNQGLLTRRDVRRRLFPNLRAGRWTHARLVDYQLRTHNIRSPQVEAKEDECPGWMRMGFRLFHRLEELGYRLMTGNATNNAPQEYPASEDVHEIDSPKRTLMEVYPYAFYTVLLGQTPFPKYSLEGRLQRQLVLYEHKVKIPDPMRFFEEITKHKLLRGVLPTEELYLPGELDALAGAYTAWQAILHPDQIKILGDPLEGEVILPVAELKERY